MSKEEVKEARKKLGLSRAALAEKIGYSRQHILNVEKGLTGFSKRFIREIELLTKNIS